VLASMVLKSREEIRYFIGAVIVFTLLPAKIWLGLAAAAFVMYRNRATGARK